MHRREALKGVALLPLIAHSVLSKSTFLNSRVRIEIIKPPRLKTGDTIGVIAPSSGVSEETFEEGLQHLADLGFKTKIGRYARERNGFLAGSDQERLRDLHWAFQDSEVDGIWCMRGGYGASRILPQIDFGLIKRNPKVFIGFSDITALHLAIFQKTGLVTFHGPVGASDFSDYTRTHVLNTIMKVSAPYEIELPAPPEGADPTLYKTIVVNGGKCRGRLIGGNLSLISALNGTDFGLKDVRGKILFLEDVSEAPYRVDRMLTQLIQSVDMRLVAGIALGVFTKTENEDDSPSQSMIDVFRDRLGGLGVPVIYGLSFGHIRDQFTLPIGVEAELDTLKSTLTLLEAAVV